MEKLKFFSSDQRLIDIGWSIFNTYGTSIVSFSFVLILTRLISPETFGFVAKFVSIILVINVIVEAGRTTDLSRKNYISNTKLDQAMGWIFIRGIISLILFNFFIILIFPSEIIFWESFLMSLIIISSSMQSIPVMLLVRNKRFKIKAVISISSAIISGIISVSLALNGLEFYALVFGQLINGVLLASLSYKYSNYVFTPARLFLKNVSIFNNNISNFIMLSSLTEKSIQAILYNVIGKVYGLESLGYITRADTLKNATSTALSKAVNRVAYSHNVELFHKTKKKPIISHFFFLLVFSFFSLPLIVISCIFANNIIIFLFGSNWVLVAQYLAPVICFGYFLSLINFNNSFFVSVGLSKSPLIFNIIMLILIGISYYHIKNIDLNEFLWMIVCASCLVFLISIFYLFYISKRKNLL